MLAGYREVLAHRGARAFCSAGFLARLPVSMTTVAVVFFVHEVIGSYAVAGIMSAIAICSSAVGGPVFGRLVDRLGQARVLVPQIVVHVVAMVIEATAVLAHAPTVLLFAVSVPAGGFTPPVGGLGPGPRAAVLAGRPGPRPPFAAR